ncbi:MAG: type I glutamate--ammonia ligase [Nitrososphaerota archaeon]|nr:type I glutamate--ammonia ligase [Nitrososphaerota archaeon]
MDFKEYVKLNNVKFIDLHFTDIVGRLHHVTVTGSYLDDKIFTEGVPKLDGSSIKGFAEIYDSDMVLKPDITTLALLPWSIEGGRTARMICDVYKGYGGGRSSKDPRYVAQRAEEYLVESGFDASYWGPEVEFFIFDKVFWDISTTGRGMSYYIESREAPWSSSSIGKGYPIRLKEGYFPVPPQDTLMEYRSEVCRILTEYFRIEVDAHHHEVATAGQCEIDLKYDNLVKMADNVQTYKYVVKNVAWRMGLIATFMPKPLYGDNGSGMHVHVSIWKDGLNLFYDPDDDYAELSQLARYFIGGLLEHSRALSAIVAPTTNSYRRLTPGYEAPVFIAWSKSNRSANVRVPAYFRGGNNSSMKRIEFRTPDSSANPYLCFASILAAGLDGIKNKIEPGDPVDEDIYKLTSEKRRELGVRELPGSLKDAVESLKSDREFLKPVMSDELIDTIIEIEMSHFIEVNSKPHPYEFYLYFDI